MSASSKDRPNVIFLMTDQQRWDALGSVNPRVKTPNLDALAARGVRFENAVCNVPMCVPSRYSMMSGLYPSQIGVRHNTQMCPTDDDLPVPVLAQRLQHAGYQTAGFGKTHWYVGGRIMPDTPTVPSTRGFEVRAQARGLDPLRMEPGAVMMAADDPEAFERLQAEKARHGPGGERAEGYTGETSAVPVEDHQESWLTRQALGFLEEDRDASRPLFLYLSFDFPHPGFDVPEGYEALYDLDEIPDRPVPPWEGHADEHPTPRADVASAWEEKTPLERRRTTLRYYALCTYVDDCFGRVLRKLEALGELENSLIVFTADHGEMLGDRRHTFSKYCLYEGSVRVPLILAGAGMGPDRAGAVDDRDAELVDVLPTVLDACGLDVPAALPGHSLLGEPARCGSFAEMHGMGYEPVQLAPAYMWRTKAWKLILYLPGEITDAAGRLDEIEGELYHLEHDPFEWTNLYDDPDYLPVRERLTRELLMHVACAWAKYPRQAARAALTPEASVV